MGQSRKALIIGIDDYPDIPLKCCCNDADAIKQLLSFHEDGSPNFSVKKLKNVMILAALIIVISGVFSFARYKMIKLK